MFESPAECARHVMETVPTLMRAIRKEMRSYREAGLSVPQFRLLIYLNRNEGVSLSDVAGHLGLSLPAMSRMVTRSSAPVQVSFPVFLSVPTIRNWSPGR